VSKPDQKASCNKSQAVREKKRKEKKRRKKKEKKKKTRAMEFCLFCFVIAN